jgi:hypothetical protein
MFMSAKNEHWNQRSTQGRKEHICEGLFVLPVVESLIYVLINGKKATLRPETFNYKQPFSLNDLREHNPYVQKKNSVVSVRKAKYTDRATAASRRN